VTPSLLVLSPTRGTVSDGYCDAYADLGAACRHHGIRLQRRVCDVPGLLDHARNVLLGQAISPTEDSEHVMWIDADNVVADPMAILGLMRRPELARDCIALAYRSRTPDLPSIMRAIEDGRTSKTEIAAAEYIWNVRPEIEDGRLVRGRDRKLVRMNLVGFGLTMFRTNTLRDFARNLVEREGPERRTVDWTGRRMLRAFDMMPYQACRHGGGHGCADRKPVGEIQIPGGEDIGFWQRWCADGREVWCAPGAWTANGHAGGRYADHLESRYEERGPWL
jgi:hypothetical protein